MLGQTSGVSCPHQNKENILYQYTVCPQTISFRGTAQQPVDLKPLDF
jgi:hypothetical protein